MMLDGMMQLIAMGTPPGGAGQQDAPGTFYWVGMMGIMVAIIYIMVLRPQRRREVDRKKLLDSVKSGDRVIFGGGLIGTVTNVKEKMLVVRVADKVKLEVLRGAVTHLVQKGELPDEDPNP